MAPLRHPWLAQSATGALLAALLGGCSGTTFGDRLAGSFSTPPAAPVAAPAATPATTTASSKPQAGSETKPTTKRAATGAKPAAPEPKPLPRATAITPAPYRITIKLPSADPSAPAEVVTEALRQAGVPFEVEMIERVSGSTTTPAPVAAPAPRAR